VTFADLELHPDLLKAVQALNYRDPTPIQRKAIPPALDGRDVLACAMTGSGKTAAFLLPLIQRFHQDGPGGKGVVRALVLTPTRELAAQIVADLADLSKGTDVTGQAVFGGVGMGPQEKAFRRGVDVLVACPGRLLDHLSRPYARLDGVRHLVLDEADRMLDMGFLPDIKRVLKQVPKKRQTLFFSATMPRPIIDLSRDLLHDPVRLDVERRSQPATGVVQAVYAVPQLRKQALLIELLDREMAQALVFTRTKHRADRVSKALMKAGVNAERLHGNRTQGQRTRALEGFKSGKFRVLVATDIAARGIDVEALGHVVNFDVPGQPEDYIHRVGRTGRASQTGEAYTFVAPEEEDSLRDIEKAVGRSLKRLVLEDFDLTVSPARQRARDAAVAASKAGRSGGGGGGRGQGGRGGAGKGKAPKGAVRPGKGKSAGAKSGGKSGGKGKSPGGKSGWTHEGKGSSGPAKKSSSGRRPAGLGSVGRGRSTGRSR
jgi:ATP-dependent RNA helicase RhlE